MTAFIDNDIRRGIVDIFNHEENVAHLFLFDNIPPKKLRRAIRTYAATLNENSPIIFLYDGSAFGSGGAGFILTPDRLFYKDLVSEGHTAVCDITEITFSPHASPEASLMVKANAGNFQIGVWDLEGSRGAATLRILHKTINLLNNNQGNIAASAAVRAIDCPSCGARYAGNVRVCEYCGLPV